MRILLDWLTVRGRVYRAGAVVDGDDHLLALAREGEHVELVDKPAPVLDRDGFAALQEKFGISRKDLEDAGLSLAEESPAAEVNEDPVAEAREPEPTEESPADEAPPEPTEDPVAESVPVSDLDQALLAGVAEGLSKSRLLERLGQTDRWTYREVSARFDELLDGGRIVAGEKRGTYTLAEAK
ncbi:MAG: hypothetical protein AB7S38_28990 [Vulcanimicrobiota bacterium]